MNIYIYQNNKLLIGIIAPSIEEFNNNPQKFYPSLQGEFVTSEFKYDYPLIENGLVRNKTRDERILMDNEVSLLVDGEIIENNMIVQVPIPSNLHKPIWQSQIWIEGYALENAREDKRKELQIERDRLRFEPYLYPLNNELYDADFNARNLIFQSESLYRGTEQQIAWVTADNKPNVLINAVDMLNIVNGIAFREQELFTNYNTKYENVLVMENLDDILAVKF